MGTSVAPAGPLMESRQEAMVQPPGIRPMRSLSVAASISSWRVSLIMLGLAVCSLLLLALLYLSLPFDSAAPGWLKQRSTRSRSRTDMEQVFKTRVLGGHHFAPGCMRGRDCISARM